MVHDRSRVQDEDPPTCETRSKMKYDTVFFVKNCITTSHCVGGGGARETKLGKNRTRVFGTVQQSSDGLRLRDGLR